MDRVFEPLIDDLIRLETEGVYVAKMQKNVKGSVTFISADNLSSHSVSGFFESFGPTVNRLCRVCLAPRAELNEKFADQFELRTPENYNSHIDLVEQDLALPTAYGIKFNSPFNRLRYGHIINLLPPDLSHDLCEGVIPRVLTLALKYFICEKKFFTLDFLKYKLKNFPLGPQDKRNLFDFIPLDFATRRGGIGGNATKNLYLLRFLLFFVADKIPETDSVLNLVAHLFDIVQIIMSERIPDVLLIYLDVLIREHRQLYLDCFLEDIFPKMHYRIALIIIIILVPYTVWRYFRYWLNYLSIHLFFPS